MRKLKTTDIFSFCRTVKKLGIKDKIKSLSQEANSAQDVWDNGFNIIWELFDAATENNGEASLYDFLAGPLEMKPKEIRELDLDKLLPMLQQLAAENNLVGFFKSAAGLMK